MQRYHMNWHVEFYDALYEIHVLQSSEPHPLHWFGNAEALIAWNRQRLEEARAMLHGE